MMARLTRRKLILVAAGACGSALLDPLSAWTQTSDETSVQDPEEYAVYSAVLNALFASPKLQQFVINSETSSKTKPAFVGFIGGLTWSGAKQPETESDTASDFDAKNDKSYLLNRQFDLKMQYVLVASAELHTIFVQDAGGHPDMESWTRFYKQYPAAPGILAFSRVGLNSRKRQALVYVTNQRGLVGGSGAFVVLAKTGKTWEVQKQVMVWIS
jgi:hypothetical protein